MKNVLCSRCKQRPAVVFISKVVDGKAEPEGLCLKCAMELNIGPIKQMLDSMGMTEEDAIALTDQIGDMFEDLDLQQDGDGDFEPGGSPAMPFNKSFFENISKNLGLSLPIQN